MITSQEYYSIGGGFIIEGNKENNNQFYIADRSLKSVKSSNNDQKQSSLQSPVYPFYNAEDLLSLTHSSGMPISRIVMENECI